MIHNMLVAALGDRIAAMLPVKWHYIHEHNAAYEREVHEESLLP